jgi:hypothetical protein
VNTPVVSKKIPSITGSIKLKKKVNSQSGVLPPESNLIAKLTQLRKEVARLKEELLLNRKG